MTSPLAATLFEPSRSGHRRPFHWVIKVGDLKATARFFDRVFGMKVHRNEEFDEGCDATCNGPYAGKWSKTMMGFCTEDVGFALELTANYGIDTYELGNDLRYIALRNDGFEHRAKQAGYPVTEFDGHKVVTSPDGQRFALVDTTDGCAHEPFLFVSLNVSDLERSKQFYSDVLGAEPYLGLPGHCTSALSAMFGFAKQSHGAPGRFDTVKIELVQLPADTPLDHKAGLGRMATGTDKGAPDTIAAKVKESGLGQIVHGPLVLKPHNEHLVVVADPDGYEYCFCVEETFQITAGVPFIDWDYRDSLERAAERWAKRARKSDN